MHAGHSSSHKSAALQERGIAVIAPTFGAEERAENQVAYRLTRWLSLEEAGLYGVTDPRVALSEEAKD